MVGSYLLSSLLHPTPSSHNSGGAEQLSPSPPSASPSSPLARIGGFVMSTEDGGVILDGSWGSSASLCWKVINASNPSDDWVYIQDSYGRYLATDRRPKAELNEDVRDGPCRPVMMSEEKTDDCRWWLPVIARGGIVKLSKVALRNA
jgi:hypothetical protein